MNGIVRWFNNDKGYGFIKTSESENIFVHYTQIQVQGFKTLKEGDEVEFELQDGDKGLQAKNVVSLSA